LRKVIIDKAERLYKTTSPFFSRLPGTFRLPKLKDQEMIDLGSIRYECFIYPDFFSEVAAVYANPASMKLASEEELRSALTKVSAFYYQQFNVNFHSHPSIVIMTAGVPTEILLCLGIVNTGDRVALVIHRIRFSIGPQPFHRP